MKLPNAPLIEVVFELRWRVENTGDFFGFDPGFPTFREAFKNTTGKLGYRAHEQVFQGGPTFVHQITDRWRKDEAFPILQIGHGILACNLSTEYDWLTFKSLIDETCNAWLDTYPDTEISPLRLSRFELRYVDVFNEAAIGNISWQDFMAKHLKFNFETIPYLQKVAVSGTDLGNLQLAQELAEPNLGKFELQIASRKAAEPPSILMTSKVVKENFDQDYARSSLKKLILEWAESAHQVTHSFFSETVEDALMAKFQGNKA